MADEKCPVCKSIFSVYGNWRQGISLHIVKQAKKEALMKFAFNSKDKTPHADYIKKHGVLKTDTKIVIKN